MMVAPSTHHKMQDCNSMSTGDSPIYHIGNGEWSAMGSDALEEDADTIQTSCHTRKESVATMREIRNGDEAEQYEEWLHQNWHMVDVILNEIDKCCTYDWPQRLNSILTVATGLWMPMNTVIMEALSKCSMKVALSLINQVDKHWLTDPCSSGEYSGGTVLHMVIAQGEINLMRILLRRLQTEECLRLICSQAHGRFRDKFLKGYGYNPVCLALLVGQFDIFDKLIKIGGDLNATDSISGNSTMHNLVIFASTNPDKGVEIMREILDGNISKQWYCRKNHLHSAKFTKKERKEMKQQLLSHVNQDGYTPLALATKYMIAPMVEYLLNCEGVYKHTQWRVGGSSSTEYDITEIDPVATHNKVPHQPNIMELFVYSNEEDFAALKSDPLASIMQKKWQMYRTSFFIFAVFHVLFMAVITTDVLFFARMIDMEIRNKESPEAPLIPANMTQEHPDLRWYQTHVGHDIKAVIACVAISYLLWSLYDFFALLYNAVKNMCRFRKNGPTIPKFAMKKVDHFDVVLFLFSVCLIASFGFRDIDITYSNVFNAMSLLLGWYFCLFFARAFPQTCYITILVVRILFTDFPRLLFIIILVLLGFSSGLILLFASEAPEGFSSFSEILETMTFLGIGIGEIEQGVLAVEGWVSVVIYLWILSYYMFTSILLLNILVATMTETYARMSQCKHLIAMRLRVKSILTIERRIPPCFHRLLLKRAYTETDNGRWMLTVKKW